MGSTEVEQTLSPDERVLQWGSSLTDYIATGQKTLNNRFLGPTSVCLEQRDQF